MSFLLPEAGLLFWMLVAFGIVFFVLYKFGFPVITSMIDERKKFIDDALRNAKEANEKLQGIEQQGRDLLEKARDEQARILREASDMRKQIIDEAREKAAEESAAMIAEARRVIQQEKEEALLDIRSQVAGLSIAVAEKLLRKELEGGNRQQVYAEELVDELVTAKKDV